MNIDNGTSRAFHAASRRSGAREPSRDRRAASLQLLSGEELLHQAKTFGVPLEPELAFEIAEYLDVKRSLAMTYNR